MKNPLSIKQMVVRETPADLYTVAACKRCRTPEDAANIARAAMATEPMTAQGTKEGFWALHLNARNGLISVECVTIGLLDSSLVHPREVFRGAIAANAHSVVLVHNHPSGDPTPSVEDVRITRQLIYAGKIVDILIMDHIIIGQAQEGRPGHLSMQETGVCDFARL